MSTPVVSRKDQKYLAWAAAGAGIFSTCAKASYMAIVVDRYGIVVGTGYNGAPPGQRHCTDGGCPRGQDHEGRGGSYANCVAVHAEANALLRVSRQDCDGATLYVTGMPCWECSKLIVGSGVRRVVFLSGRDPIDLPALLDLHARSGVELIELSPDDLPVAASRRMFTDEASTSDAETRRSP